MPEFLTLIPPAEALEILIRSLPPDRQIDSERIPTEAALGRVLTAEVVAESPLPPFRRSTVDGFAVRARDTYGASPSLPAYLRLIGEIPMGAAAGLKIGAAEAAVVHTGGMLAEGADAVVMLEDTRLIDAGEIEVYRAVALGQNVLEAGEDVQPGEVVLQAGSRLRPQEIGGLMALGITEVRVARKPRVGIISTGDEVVEPAAEALPGQVRDVNSYTLSGLVEQAGATAVRRGIIGDQMAAIRTVVARAQQQDDLVIVTAGSSVSARDVTSQIFDQLAPPGVLVHGVAIKPGKPTILANAAGVPLIGLPGNPVSALVIAGLFVTPVIRYLLGMRGPQLSASLNARMTTNVSSETGREDYLPVRLQMGSDGMQAEPVYGRSNLIFTLVRADGLVRIPPAATGLAAGELVQVRLF